MAHQNKQSNLLIIMERDVGLFSTVLQVLNSLALLQTFAINRTPVVLLGQGITYFHHDGHQGRKSVWEYYFEPLVDNTSEESVISVLGERAFELLESKRKQLEHHRGAIEFPEDLHTLIPLSDQDQSNLHTLKQVQGSDWFWTEAFNPTVNGMSLKRTTTSDQVFSHLVQRYIRPRRYIMDKVFKLYNEQLQGYHNIGVHVRGTDGLHAPNRGVKIPFDRYYYYIEKQITEFGRDTCRIFLATDEQYIVDLFKNRYGESLVYYNAIRNTDNTQVFGQGPTGQIMPAYISKGDKAAVQNGEDAVVEYALLCKCDTLIHNLSSLALAARYSVADNIQA